MSHENGANGVFLSVFLPFAYCWCLHDQNYLWHPEGPPDFLGEESVEIKKGKAQSLEAFDKCHCSCMGIRSPQTTLLHAPKPENINDTSTNPSPQLEGHPGRDGQNLEKEWRKDPHKLHGHHGSLHFQGTTTEQVKYTEHREASMAPRHRQCAELIRTVLGVRGVSWRAHSALTYLEPSAATLPSFGSCDGIFLDLLHIFLPILSEFHLQIPLPLPTLELTKAPPSASLSLLTLTLAAPDYLTWVTSFTYLH